MFPNYSQMITDNCEFDKEHTNYLIPCYLQKLIEKFAGLIFRPNRVIKKDLLFINLYFQK